MVVEINENYVRLSDRILYALERALDQEDAEIAEDLLKVLEKSMTRNTGGGEFIERRDYPKEVEAAFSRFEKIKAGK